MLKIKQNANQLNARRNTLGKRSRRGCFRNAIASNELPQTLRLER
jgi:hypothetical protein